MCLSVYIASDLELPLVPWNKSKPSFYVTELEYDKDVTEQFSLPNVRFVGSDAGCGCGFLKDGVEGQELIEALENYKGLAKYVGELIDQGAAVQIFVCWAGYQRSKPEFIETIKVSDLLAEDFELKEKALYTIR